MKAHEMIGILKPKRGYTMPPCQLHVGQRDFVSCRPSRYVKNTEVSFKDTKQLPGLGHYQNRPYTAAVTHLHLVCFVCALLTHSAIERTCAQEKRSKKAHVPVRELQNDPRRIVWDDTAKYLQELPDEKHVFKELSRLLVAA